MKLEAWQEANRPKEDPAIARRKARIRALTASAEGKEQKAELLRAQILVSPAYQRITGGSETWYEEAQARADHLQKVLSLGAKRYTVLGRIEARSEGGFYIMGMAISPKSAGAPGAFTTERKIFIAGPKKGWLRDNGNFFAGNLFLHALVDERNPSVVFGATLPQAAKGQLATAKAEFKRVQAVIKSGKAKIAAMFKPAQKLEAAASKLRAAVQKLREQAAGPKR